MIRKKNIKIYKKIWPYIQYFCKQTTVHGFNIVGLSNLHWSERLFWFVIVIISASGAISLTISNFNRYSANPTVISIQKDYRNWQNHIPAVTGCFDDKVDLKNAQKYILKKWNHKPSDSKFEFYLDFVKTVANASYENFDSFQKFQHDQTLTNIDLAELAINVHPKITGTLVTVDKSREYKWNLILTELGICFTFFSKFASLLSPKNNLNPNRTQQTEESLLICYYLNGLCYARFDSDPTLPIKYYVHSYLEVPDISMKQYHSLHKTSDMEIDYRVIETHSSPDVKYLTPAQRKCRYDNEPTSKIVSIYSLSICQMTCRYNLAMKFCGCKPFFYHFFRGTTCNITGLLCLSKYKEILTINEKLMGCKCLQTCQFLHYLPETPKLAVWDSSVYFDQRTTFRWGLLHPTTRYRRDIIFGFGDLIVSIGGTLNLFLGISFISIIEMIYLFYESIANIFFKLRKEQKKKASSNKKNKSNSNILSFY